MTTAASGVLGPEAGASAWVLPTGASPCAGCPGDAGCLDVAGPACPRKVLADNPRRLAAGVSVGLRLPTGTARPAAAAAVFGVPLLGMVVGVAVGVSWWPRAPDLGALAGWALGLGLALPVSAWVGTKLRLRPLALPLSEVAAAPS